LTSRGRARAGRRDEPSADRDASPASIALGRLREALGSQVGPAVVLDAELRVVASTSGASEILGAPIGEGAHFVKLLGGSARERPLAEALARGEAIVTTVRRDGPLVERAILVRAVPFGASDPARDSDGSERRSRRSHEPRGWVVALRPDDGVSGAGDAASEFCGMWTRDSQMREVFRVLERAAKRDASVLVRGESGSGKELAARAVHDLSPRRGGPFAAINCAALPPTLLESELFGHVRGAFTGASRDHLGIFRSASRGTLLLDEVAEMPLELQAKLLRVLETKTVIPVGGRDPIAVDVRIVAATHQSLRAAVEAGRFRADLMYRLRVIPIFLPPLRARVGDVPLLVGRLLLELNRQGGRQVLRVDAAAEEALCSYGWPGNVRELRNALEYAFVIGEGPVLLPSDLPPEILTGGGGEPRVDRPAEPRAAEAIGSGDATETARIERALERAGGNRERAARLLGLSRVTLWRRMRELGIASSRRRLG
jgi:two-component system response regulator AtoC